MKAAFLALFLICTTGAFGQGYLSSEPQIYVPPDHPGHARNHSMATDQNLRGDESPYTYAHGERPLSDVAQTSTQIPLGDIARQLKKEHASEKKARIVWEN